ncbi:MAG: T9SS type A sorting domain-containing protein [Bacteroidetes bacterium]|nr:T9SS type A sorting domain-containing protein [Bacteroidota bacterium]
MKKPILLLVFLFIHHFTGAQQISWLQSDTMGYNSNPQFPLHKLAVTNQGVVVAKLSASHQLFGSDILGDYTVASLDSSGSLLWSVDLSGKVLVTALAVDGAEDIYLGGEYIETILINGVDSLTNTGSGFDQNYFLMSFSPQGVLRWKKNLSLTNNDIQQITTLEKDANGYIWYVYQHLLSFSHEIIQLDNIGNELLTYTTTRTRLCNSISFDAANNLYLAGATESGTININGLSETVPESYMMFVSRINNFGQTSWIRFGIDITFQTPQVVALPNGDAILGGNNFDSTSWGNLVFPDNFFGTNFFLTRVDSNANFLWGYGLPLNDTGYYSVGSGHFFDVDASDNIYVTGTIQGTIHFTPTLVVNSGLPATYNLGILKLDGSGQVVSLKLGGAMNSNYPQDLRVSGIGKGYVQATIGGEAIFDSLTTGLAGSLSAALIHFDDNNSTTGVHSVEDASFIAYPNPFSDRLVLDGFRGEVKVEILDVLGCLVHEQFATKGEIKLPALTRGIYFLRIDNKLIRLVKAE